MDFESNRNEFAQETLASNRLQQAIAGVFVESAEKLVTNPTIETFYRRGKTDRQAVCQFDNGLHYLIHYEEETRKQQVFYWRIKIESLDTERLTHHYNSLITEEAVVLSNQGLPHLFRDGPVPNERMQLPFLFPYGDISTAESLEELRQGIQSSYVWPLDATKKLLKQRKAEDEWELRKTVCHSIGGHVLFMAGVKFRLFKTNMFKNGS